MFYCTLRPFETFLFSGLPMMIWQKNLQTFFILQYRVSAPKEKKLVKWQKFKTALWDLTEKLLLLNFVNMQFKTEVSNQSGSQIHAWILLKKIIFVSFYSIFFRLSCFHCEWPQLATILTSFDLSFGTKSKSLIFELKQAIHGGNDLN